MTGATELKLHKYFTQWISVKDHEVFHGKCSTELPHNCLIGSTLKTHGQIFDQKKFVHRVPQMTTFFLVKN